MSGTDAALPRVSVVIPARDAAATIERQLAALVAQEYAGWWEVVVVNDGSRDATADVVAAWAARDPRVRLVRGDGRGINAARNRGARSALGDTLCFCDADDEVQPGWVAAMAEGASRYDGWGGCFVPARGTGAVDTAPAYGLITERPGWYPYPIGGCCGLRRTVWEALGGFDESVRRATDAEMFWRLQLAGFTLGLVPDAVVVYYARGTGRARFRQAVQWGMAMASLHRRHRADGMPADSLPRAAKAWARLLGDAPAACLRAGERSEWLQRAGRRVGRLLGSIRYRTRYL